MKILLVAINAKYIHSNLAVRYLKSYADKALTNVPVEIEIAEYTINQQKEEILAELYQKRPDVLAFSCYIWNMGVVDFLIQDFHKICPAVDLWLGGPEVSYDGAALLEKYPQLRGVMSGEGEAMFTEIAGVYASTGVSSMASPDDSMDAYKLDVAIGLSKVKGISFRDYAGNIRQQEAAAFINMDDIPFVYENMDGLEHRIVYYESSRGCPFSCSYCLSSLDKVRFRNTEVVCKELQFFLDAKVPQVKFVDRTFNCKHDHAQTIWRYIKDHDNGITNFHFEIAADLLNEEELQLLSQMRPGLVQLEIGVQSTNLKTIREIDRVMDLDQLQGIVDRIRSGRNIHQHLDLIAGLPEEDYASFRLSFNRVYGMKPDQLQLGFLKVLKGSKMCRKAEDYDLIYSNAAPYEVYRTRWISYDELLELKGVEEMVEVYYNSAQFAETIRALTYENDTKFETPFDLFKGLSDYYKENQLDVLKHSRLERFHILRDFVFENTAEGRHSYYEELLILDLYLRENSKKRPEWAKDATEYKKVFRDFFIKEAQEADLLIGYQGYDSKQIARMTHSEVFQNDVLHTGEKGPYLVVFNYMQRDALSGNAKTIMIKG